MNKGLEIRNNKLKKNVKKRNEVKDSQIGLLRYVTYSEREFKKVNGKYNKNNFKINKGEAVQFENKLYLSNGKTKFVNRQTLKIKQKDGTENKILEKIYNDFKEKKGGLGTC